jgi:hypothetical protein
MSFNPMMTTAENFAFIMQRHEESTASRADQECVSHEIVSTPNGQHYGKQGHVPCDHMAVFHYPAGVGKVSTYFKDGWNHHSV